ncbi:MULTISPECIES: energy-coupling factor transporter transmembrane protein EcfT [unclassified Microcoleus]|uniref:energy-coupling factor transporter transmembrane component T family protein n=1 Tax=unclassified Microcoleus TaxID=2642155 RepID=UPI001DD14178|nr:MULTISPECIES: energy-coupling factor transporter transmembrane protein EcfT [unclassified Microcoleus]MCC3568670.1 energy-coupling factor transporter transmembrane protein EcfT [Microcoleus sp. PH2017_31_RDM_U_A]MCC3581022.1 energy-coupling factor transporter transmembrane protein EcfT [Microcoleus sp. PH2017_32_RDM_D_A]MCC3619069.1 energy-coupling factor transporter transmembrane protein EcfT [Microcoleus sp. PH2017_38_RDM_U_B]
MDLLRSLPIGLYLEQPVTWLHRLDSRVKLAWLMTFLIAPILANPVWRLMLVVMLIVLTLSAAIPFRVWKQQMGLLLLFCLLVFCLSAIAPDALPSEHQPRIPADELTFSQQPATLPPAQNPKPWYKPFNLGSNSPTQNPKVQTQNKLPQPTNYSYVLFKQGPVKITRKSLDLAINVSTLFFTVIYSTNLYLLTTASEEITAAIENLMQPLRRLRWPVTEIALTLTLSLRFIPLVLEEIQNLVRSVSTRAINWKKLGFRRASQVWLTIAERLLENLLLRAEQIASAMKVRGFTSPDRHRVEWHQLHFKIRDWIALGCLLALWSARLAWGWDS